MRAISIRQPWASLTAAGIRDIDVSNRDTKYRGRVLLHASSRRVGRDFGHDVSPDWLARLRNAQMMGLVPYDEEVPVSAVIGTALLTDCTSEPQDSPWSATGNNWVLREAVLFDQPILDVKGKQGLFDLPEITEELLPTRHPAFHPETSYREGVFSLSMTDEELERQRPELPIVLMICGDLLAKPLLEDKEGHTVLKPVGQLEIITPTTRRNLELTEASLSEEGYITFEIRL